MNRSLLIALLISSGWLAAGCSPAADDSASRGALPKDWYIGSDARSEDEPTEAPVAPESIPDESKLSKSIEAQFSAEAGALESLKRDSALDAQGVHAISSEGKPSNWVPWHMQAFITDLSISASGILGSLLIKGTPAIVAIWKKQYPPPTGASSGASVSEIQAPENDEAEGIEIPEGARGRALEEQIEPAVRVALASGKVRDEGALRSNLVRMAEDFSALSSTLAIEQERPWRPSRLRLDLSFDASGKVTPMISVGGDVRLRFEWHRRKPKPGRAPVSAPRAESNERLKRMGESLRELVSTLAEDLNEVAIDNPKLLKHGFDAHNFRVGFGITHKGTIGIAKASSTMVGHLYFSRDTSRPVVNPKPTATPLSFGGGSNSILMVDEPGREGASTRLDRGKFRKGLKKAVGIGAYFAKRASKAHMGKWRIYEMKLGFELNLQGKMGLSPITGIAATQLSMFNRGF